MTGAGLRVISQTGNQLHRILTTVLFLKLISSPLCLQPWEGLGVRGGAAPPQPCCLCSGLLPARPHPTEQDRSWDF